MRSEIVIGLLQMKLVSVTHFYQKYIKKNEIEIYYRIILIQEIYSCKNKLSNGTTEFSIKLMPNRQNKINL